MAAQSGLLGGLLGNLLCSVSGLLDNAINITGLTQIASVLNQILGQLPL